MDDDSCRDLADSSGKSCSAGQTDWKHIWDGIRYARSLRGGKKEDLSDFVIRDRQGRR